MRYDNWDVILFPRDFHVPIQEFKTACFVAQDEYGRQLPTLTCYIASLPAATPFRVSIHSWSSTTKPSALIESQRKQSQRVVYTIRIDVDGARVFYKYYELGVRWPQEIVNEKRSMSQVERPSSERKPALEFPPFRQDILMRSSWDARDASGRIKIFLSEQLLSKSNSPGELEFGPTNELVCFSFQHAPKDILEQAGISWPIRNPLYLPPTSSNPSQGLQPPKSFPRQHQHAAEIRTLSPLTKQSEGSLSQPGNAEVNARSKGEAFPSFSPFPKPSIGDRGAGRPGIWDDSLVDPFDDVSMMDSWSTQRAISHSTADVSMADLATSVSSRPRTGWHNPPKGREGVKSKGWDEGRRKLDRDEKQVIMTLRDDQFGALMEALSPPKVAREQHHRLGQDRSHSVQPASRLHLTKMGPPTASFSTRPSAAALARSASYSDFSPHLRNVSNRASPLHQDGKQAQTLATQAPHFILSSMNLSSKDTHHSSPVVHSMLPSGKENHMPLPNTREDSVTTHFPFEDAKSVSYPFLRGGNMDSPAPKLLEWESDIEMRDPSSLISSLSRLDKGDQRLPAGMNSPASIPEATGSVKSRKEGLGVGLPATSTQDARHGKSLLPSLGTPNIEVYDPKVPQNTPVSTSPALRIEDIINAADDTKPFAPGHRSGMNSLDSIGQRLFSALGDGNSFDDTIAPAGLPLLDDFDSPVAKRKRQGTMGGERGKSPESKMVKEGGDDERKEDRGGDDDV